VEHVNRLAETLLHRQGLVVRQAPHYRGKPIMITQNDYALMLFNGDCGIFLPGECRLPTVSKPTLWEPMENYVSSPPHGSPARTRLCHDSS